MTNIHGGPSQLVYMLVNNNQTDGIIPGWHRVCFFKLRDKGLAMLDLI